MAEELPQYYAVLTDAGAALEARALEAGVGVVLTHIVVGDANLSAVTPDPAVTALTHEVYRCAIDARSRDENDPKITLLHATIPADAGGFWIYELGVVGQLEGEDEEVLYAYANHGRYYKMLPQDGQTVTHELTIPIIQSTDAKVTIQVADDGYATRKEYLLLSSIVESLRATRCAVWTLETPVAEGGKLTFPDGLRYISGCNAVRLSYDGVVCHQGTHFTEMENGSDGFATGVTLHFSAPAGSEFETYIHGHSDALPLNDEEQTAIGLSALTSRLSSVESSVTAIRTELRMDDDSAAQTFEDQLNTSDSNH